MGEGCSIFMEKLTFCEDNGICLLDPHTSIAKRRLPASYYIWRVLTKHTLADYLQTNFRNYYEIFAATIS